MEGKGVADLYILTSLKRFNFSSFLTKLSTISSSQFSISLTYSVTFSNVFLLVKIS